MAENPQAAEIAYLPEAAPYHNEGKTVASWVAMAGVTLGAIIAAIGFAVVLGWVIAVGVVVIVISLVVGLVLRNRGYGQPKAGVTPRDARH
jgi:hypothetical protein